MIFVDSNAWISLYRPEEGRGYLIRTILAALSWRVVGSPLVRVETERTLVVSAADAAEATRLLDDFRIAWNSVEQVEIDDEMWDLARQISITTRLRAPDALHLAAVERLGARGTLLLTFDRELARVARDRGFSVVGEVA